MSRRSQNFSQWTSANSSTPITTNPSRKRCRDECSDENPESGLVQACSDPIANSILANDAHMVLTDSINDHPMSVESQIAILPEEKQDIELHVKVEMTSQTEDQFKETSVPKPKFQRRDTSSNSNDKGDASKASRNSLKSSEDPVIDQFTHILGVGWARVSDDIDIQAAVRGWARYIENHYPVSLVKLVLKSKGLEAYLAETKNGYFLFSEDLSKGRLVGSCWETCLANLQQSPIVYESMEVLKASRTMAPQLAPSPPNMDSACMSISVDPPTSSFHSTPAEDTMILL